MCAMHSLYMGGAPCCVAAIVPQRGTVTPNLLRCSNPWAAINLK